MLKTIFIHFFKTSLALGSLIWLYQSGKLNPTEMMKIFSHPEILLGAFILGIFNFCLVTLRWRNLLDAQSKSPLSYLGLLKVNYIGQFFNSILPGSVSGDLVKILYVEKSDERMSKKFIFTSVFIDRIMGLTGLLLIVGISSFFVDRARATPLLLKLIDFNITITLLLILGLSLFFFFSHQMSHLIKFVTQKLPSKMSLLINELWENLVILKSKLLTSILLSMLIQFIGVFIFWFVNQSELSAIKLTETMVIVPLGFISTALPIAPSGVGVGHAVFQKLFEIYHVNTGANLFNTYFLITLLFNLGGVIPYLFSKIKK